MRHYAGSAVMLLVTTAVIVGSYTVNLKVSAERAEVERLRRTLVADARSIRDLEAELRTRARPPQIQRWNDDVLMMATPAAGQYLRNPMQLASFAAPADTAPAVRNAVTTPVPVAPAATAPIVRAAYRPAPETPSKVVSVAYRPAAPRAAPPLVIIPETTPPAAAPVDLIEDGGQ
jgi:hypothetical protein